MDINVGKIHINHHSLLVQKSKENTDSYKPTFSWRKKITRELRLMPTITNLFLRSKFALKCKREENNKAKFRKYPSDNVNRFSALGPPDIMRPVVNK